MGFAKYHENVTVLPEAQNRLHRHNSDKRKTALRTTVLSRLRYFLMLVKKTKTRYRQANALQLRQSVLDIAVEEYRMREAFMNIIYRLNPTDIPRFESRYRYFSKEVEKAVNNAGFRLVGAEEFVGKPFDVGMAVKPLNINNFDTSDVLVVDQMIEPVIMEGEAVARIGVVKLRRK